MIREAIDGMAWGIEILAVLIIVGGILHGVVRFPYHYWQGVADAYSQIKERLGKTLMLGLEILIAADVIRTVTLDPTLGNAAILAILVIIRTFLSWSLVVEMEGRWPWQSNPGAATEKRPVDSSR
jgi:uncharacterized membrane protein